MKNACIVIRDKEQHFVGGEFEPVVGALIDGGASRIEEQVLSGIAVRMAILFLLTKEEV